MNLTETEQERARLAETIAEARRQLEAVRGKLGAAQDEIASARHELFDEASRSGGSLWGSQSFEELAELAQYANAITLETAKFSREAVRAAALERMAESPYFARLDFLFDGESAPEAIYIGRASLTDEATFEIYVYDWRTPIASVFYRFGAGRAYYDAPQGRIEGELRLKRQYEIKRGELEFFFDADVQIVDEFLRKLLSQNTSTRMKTIVETIQKDQDIVIRDMEHGLLMVQGVAGSGKTSVGLHRVAYLMYQALAGRVSKNDIVILSPNTLFEQYIENVLPELGEESVRSLVAEELFERLTGLPAQPRGELIEALIACEDAREKALMKNSMAFKGSLTFAEILERLVGELPKLWIDFGDVYYADQRVAAGEELRAAMMKPSKDPVAVRLARLEKPIFERVHDLRPQRVKDLEAKAAENPAFRFEVRERARADSIAESTELAQKVRAFTRVDCFALYRRLFADKEAFLRLAEGLALPADIGDIIDATARRLSICHEVINKTDAKDLSDIAYKANKVDEAHKADNADKTELPYEDALALSWLCQRVNGTAFLNIRQAVVDEAQDYHPLHFALLARLYPNARFTVLGDINQTLEKEENLMFYDGVRRILDKPKSALVTMDKSFRCTNEILAFGAKFLGEQYAPQSFNRSGDAPEIHAARDEAERDALILREIEACREKGYGSIALIAKTREKARRAHERLKRAGAELGLALESGVDGLTGAFVIPVFLSKGLEFDAVIILDADGENYRTADDKKLLYICSTRALHRLAAFAVGALTPLIG